LDELFLIHLKENDLIEKFTMMLPKMTMMSKNFPEIDPRTVTLPDQPLIMSNNWLNGDPYYNQT